MIKRDQQFESDVEQPSTFPVYLLANEPAKTIHNSNTITKFIMPLEKFKILLEPMFKEQTTKHYLETFSNLSLTEEGFWLKLVHEHYKPTEAVLSIKHTTQKGEVIEVQEFNKSVSEVSECDWFTPLVNEAVPFAIVDVQRTEYVHKKDDTVTLTMDYVTFSDDNSFVVLSIRGHQPYNSYTDEKIEEIKRCIKPCRSKIMEYICRSNKELYDLLKEKKQIIELGYQSMSIAEFENGPEIARKWEMQAKELKNKLIQENNDSVRLAGEAKHSEQYISFVYRNTLKFGHDDAEIELY